MHSPRSQRRLTTLGAAAGLAALAAGCAGAPARPQRPPPALTCKTPGPVAPPEVAQGKMEGVVILDYRIGNDGTVSSISLPYPDAPEQLQTLATEWLQGCTAQPGEADPAQTQRKVFAFRAPYAAKVDEPPPIEFTSNRRRLEAPVLLSCAPREPRFLKDVDVWRLDLHVRSDGRVGDLIAGPEFVDHNGLLDSIRLWAKTCRFSPARDPDLNAVPVLVNLGLAPHLAELPPPLEDQGQPERGPMPGLKSAAAPDWCGKPRVTDLIRQEGITGLVLVSYVVHADGHVGEVKAINPAPPRLFALVREWLVHCPFKPAERPDGTSISVELIQPFTFVEVR
jgi:hypothetical protein